MYVYILALVHCEARRLLIIVEVYYKLLPFNALYAYMYSKCYIVPMHQLVLRMMNDPRHDQIELQA